MVRRTAIALCIVPLLLAGGCASAPRSATPANAAPQARAEQLRTRTPDQISAAPSLASKPLRPVPVPLDSAVAGSPSSRR